MSRQQQTRPVSLKILDKEYVVACPVDERDGLIAAAEYLSSKMQAIREGGKMVSGERLLVMTALNITHELLQYRQGKAYDKSQVGDELQRLKDKIDRALADDTPTKV